VATTPKSDEPRYCNKNAATPRATNFTYQPIEGSEIVASIMGITTQFELWLETPFPFGVVAPIGDDETNFAIYFMIMWMG